MATLELTDDVPGSLLPQMFNVDDPVFFNSNNTQDIKLVQILLREIYFKNLSGGFFSKGSQARPNELFDDDNLKPDGICGRITQRWIRAYQEDRNARVFLSGFGTKLIIDGKVSPAPFPKIQAPSGNLFTIVTLNEVCQRRDDGAFQQLLSLGVDAMADLILNQQFPE